MKESRCLFLQRNAGNINPNQCRWFLQDVVEDEVGGTEVRVGLCKNRIVTLETCTKDTVVHSPIFRTFSGAPPSNGITGLYVSAEEMEWECASTRGCS